MSKLKREGLAENRVLEIDVTSAKVASPQSGRRGSKLRGQWDQERIVAELTTLHAEGHRITLSGMRELGRDDLIAAVSRRFGSFVRARRRSGIAEPQLLLPKADPAWNWDKERLTAKLHNLHSTGQRLTVQRLSALGLDDVLGAARIHFGTLARARRRLGIVTLPRSLPKSDPAWRWNQERLVAKLQRLHAEGYRVTLQRLRALGLNAAARAIKIRFGTMAHARQAAGIPDQIDAQPRPAAERVANERVANELVAVTGSNQPRKPGTRTRWTSERAVQIILQRAADGAPLTRRRTPDALVFAGIRIFGSWRAAVEAAGLDYTKVSVLRRRTPEDVIAQIRELSQTHPSMTWSQLQIRIGNAIRHFESPSAAVQAAGITGWPISKHGTWSRQRVLDTLKLHRHTAAVEVSGLVGAARKHFGGLLAARAAARLPQLRSRWTKARVIAELRATRNAALLRHSDLERACQQFFGSVAAARALLAARASRETMGSEPPRRSTGRRRRSA